VGKFVGKLVGKFSALGNLWRHFQHREICEEIFSIGKILGNFSIGKLVGKLVEKFLGKFLALGN